MRHQASEVECRLWKHLPGPRVKGYKFHRQLMIEPYLVGFVCLDAKLIIEADGGQHIDQTAYDARWTVMLESMRYRVMRCGNNEILGELNSVLEQIKLALIEFPSPQPSP